MIGLLPLLTLVLGLWAGYLWGRTVEDEQCIHVCCVECDLAERYARESSS